MNKPKPQIRLTKNAASIAFNVHRTTLAGHLAEAHMSPGDDGKFSIADIHTALSGDLRHERIRETRAKADTLELELGIKGKLYIEANTVERRLADWSMAIVHCIRGSKMPHPDKESLLKHLEETDLVSSIKRDAGIDDGK